MLNTELLQDQIKTDLFRPERTGWIRHQSWSFTQSLPFHWGDSSHLITLKHNAGQLLLESVAPAGFATWISRKTWLARVLFGGEWKRHPGRTISYSYSNVPRKGLSSCKNLQFGVAAVEANNTAIYVPLKDGQASSSFQRPFYQLHSTDHNLAWCSLRESLCHHLMKATQVTSMISIRPSAATQQCRVQCLPWKEESLLQQLL